MKSSIAGIFLSINDWKPVYLTRIPVCLYMFFHNLAMKVGSFSRVVRAVLYQKHKVLLDLNLLQYASNDATYMFLQHVEEFLQYFRFGLWWVALGVASSIGLGKIIGNWDYGTTQNVNIKLGAWCSALFLSGLYCIQFLTRTFFFYLPLGSGLHTFVLYLGPHIALFTIKAMKCGRVDLKSAPYDTIQLDRSASWLDKNCSEFGPPIFPAVGGLSVPLSSILPQVQLEAILWGFGTALGELPPYFISRAGLWKFVVDLMLPMIICLWIWTLCWCSEHIRCNIGCHGGTKCFFNRRRRIYFQTPKSTETLVLFTCTTSELLFHSSTCFCECWIFWLSFLLYSPPLVIIFVLFHLTFYFFRYFVDMH